MKKIRLDEEQVQRSAARLAELHYGVTGKRMDEGESVFFARQLEHIIAQEFDIEYPELRARQVIPITQEADPADKTITYREFNRMGVAKLIGDYSQDLPRVDVTGKEITSNIRTIGASYGYDLDEVAASAKTGKDLEGRRAETAREAILRKENAVLLFGDTTHGLNGFLNFATVTVATIAADGTGASKLWSTKTPDQILRDLNFATNGISELTNGIEQPDTMLLPRSAYHVAATKRIGRDSNMTVLKFFTETNPYIKSMDQIEVLNELNTAGQSGVTRGMVYRRDPLKVRGEIPMDFESLPAQPRGLEWLIAARSKCGGVIWHKPLSAVYFDGI